ncbi:MAG: alginate O-acetyltransferase [Omnitrophica WOR_2 bacterium RIFOXYA12_FULL_38_10]|nr:MAG: alginate O-acetyltransferase [Omnitrophica WOR_2 bacterium RIFOXYA12_FULL_38_10]
MLFNSIQFLIFFPVVVIVYFLIDQKYRWIFLLVASYYFYMCWEPGYLLLIILSTLIDYFAAIMMGRHSEKSKRKIYLILSLFTNLSLLAIFKYYNFFNQSIGCLFNYFHVDYKFSSLNLLLPVGISFYTFQTLSYSIDVYRGDKEPEKHLGMFALYVAFFPQLVAGPIERSTRLLPQFYKKFNFDYDRVVSGLRLMLWGMFKKVVIADRLAIFVDKVYSKPDAFTGLELNLATIFFAFQIYCDFSGYSDIAIGSSKVLGFDLMKNFNKPYFARSIPEFWCRWHISLTTWFKDYLYIPLGGNKVSAKRFYFNVLVVFLLSGLWHGANWTFVIWGFLHALYYIFSKLTRNLRSLIVKIVKLNKFPVIHSFLQTVFTFILVCFSWIFFRANSLKDAIYIYSHLFFNWNKSSVVLSFMAGKTTEYYPNVIPSIYLIMFFVVVQYFQKHDWFKCSYFERYIALRWSIYLLLCLVIMNYGVVKIIPFIYFQF